MRGVEDSFGLFRCWSTRLMDTFCGIPISSIVNVFSYTEIIESFLDVRNCNLLYDGSDVSSSLLSVTDCTSGLS